MSLINLLNNQVVVSRLGAVSGSKTDWATITSESTHITQLDAEKSLNLGGSVGKTYIIYADVNADIEDGDRLQDTDTGKIYYVKAGGVDIKNLGSIDHLEILVELIKND